MGRLTGIDMRRRKKSIFGPILLRLVGGFIALLVLVSVALEFLDFAGYRRDAEEAASSALGMEVHIDGRLGFSVLTGPHVVIEKVRVRNRGTDLLSFREIRVGLDLRALLNRDVRVTDVDVRSPTVYVQRDRDGAFNYETPSSGSGSVPSIDNLQIAISRATIVYADDKTGDRIEATGCNLETRRLHLKSGKSKTLMQNLALDGDMRCAQVKSKNAVVASDLRISVAGQRGVVDLKPITVKLFGARGSGKLHADFSHPAYQFDIEYVLAQLQLERLFQGAAPQTFARGPIDASVHLSLHGASAKELRASTAGTISIRGAQLTIVGTDIDRALAKYESSQNFSFVDLGALALAGPLGLVATKGYNFASVVSGAQGDTKIGALVSDWTVEHGVAHATDVAIATRANRIAVKGRLDLVHERFDEVVIAAVDTKGCIKVQQTLRGPFQNPALDKPGVFASLAGPVINLFKKPVSGSCKAFYAGAVPPP